MFGPGWAGLREESRQFRSIRGLKLNGGTPEKESSVGRGKSPGKTRTKGRWTSPRAGQKRPPARDRQRGDEVRGTLGPAKEHRQREGGQVDGPLQVAETRAARRPHSEGGRTSGPVSFGVPDLPSPEAWEAPLEVCAALFPPRIVLRAGQAVITTSENLALLLVPDEAQRTH